MNETREITIELSGIKKLYQVGTQEVAALNGIDLKIYKNIKICLFPSSLNPILP